MLRIFSTATVLALLAVPAQAYTLTCEMTNMSQSGNWIPRSVVLNVNEEETEVGLISPEAFSDFEGAVSDSNPKRLTVKMRVPDVTSRGGQFANFEYRLTWIKKTNRATISAIPLGYSNRFTARGACAKS